MLPGQTNLNVAVSLEKNNLVIFEVTHENIFFLFISVSGNF